MAKRVANPTNGLPGTSRGSTELSDECNSSVARAAGILIAQGLQKWRERDRRTVNGGRHANVLDGVLIAQNAEGLF
jgi:hypothetical protein